jgi:hypothetical protein
MRIQLMLWAATATAWICSAEEPRPRVPICLPTFTNEYDQYAQSLASQMFVGIGVRLDWLGSRRACAEAPYAIVIEMVRQTPRTHKPGALAASLPYEGVHIVVFADRVRKSAGPLTAPALLAHVLAHEIAHLLQGVARHSETGVMREQWQPDDYLQMAVQPLPFTERDVSLIHAGLATRSARLRAASAAKR